MERFRSAAVVLAALALARASLAALGPCYGGQLTMGVARLPLAPAPWDPSKGDDPLVGPLIHEGLVRLSPEGFPVPAIAKGWTAAAGGREWTLEIEARARFHDDRPIEASDAERSLRRFLRSGSPAAARLALALDGGSAFREGAAALPGVATLDSRRLTLRLLEPLAAPLAPLAAQAAAVTGPHGQGAGPFVPVLPIPGQRLALNAFGSHLQGRPFLDGLTLVAMADEAERRAALRDGRLDLAAGGAGETRLTATLLLLLDPSRPPFDRHSRRDAVAAAIERETLARLVPGAQPAAGLLAPHLLAGRAELPAAPDSLRGAVTMAVADDVPRLVSQRIVAYLSAVGLRPGVQAMGPAAAASARSHARLIRWSPEVAEPGLALRELASLAPASRLVRNAIDAADAELDVDRRLALLTEAETALRADRVALPLGLVPASFAARSGVHGVRLDAAGRLVLEDAWMEP